MVAISGITLGASAWGEKIEKKTLIYHDGDQELEGLLVWDSDKTEKRPGVFIIHQWTGPTEHEQEVAVKLAKLGYIALVGDIYGKGVRPQPPESAQMAGKFKNDRALFRKRLLLGIEALKGAEVTDTQNLAALGYCFGGTGALELARAGAPLKGVISFHGGLGTPTPEDAKNVVSQVLVLHGADDPFVPEAEVKAFHEEFKQAGKEFEFEAYPGAVHSFTMKKAGNDPSKGSAYQKEADEQSWKTATSFLKRIFSGK